MKTPKTGRVCLLRILPLVLVPVAFLAALPWLKMVSGPMVSLIGAAAAIFVMSYGTYLFFRWRRSQDEVQKASGEFGALWGAQAGTIAFVLLLMLPPFIDFATALVRNWSGDSGAARQVVILAMTTGCCAVVLLQAIGTMVVTSIWWMARR